MLIELPLINSPKLCDRWTKLGTNEERVLTLVRASLRGEGAWGVHWQQSLDTQQHLLWKCTIHWNKQQMLHIESNISKCLTLKLNRCGLDMTNNEAQINTKFVWHKNWHNYTQAIASNQWLNKIMSSRHDTSIIILWLLKVEHQTWKKSLKLTINYLIWKI